MNKTSIIKKTTAFLLALISILVNTVSSFAYDKSLDEFIRKAENFRIIVVDQEGTTIGSITIDIDKLCSSQETLKCIKDTTFEEWDRRFKTEVMGLDPSNIDTECRLTVYYKEANTLVDSDNTEVKGTGTFSKTSKTKKTVTVVNSNYPSMSYTTTYYAHVKVTYKQSGNVITTISGTSFYTTSLSSDYATEGLSFANYVASDGHSCGTTANYTLYRYWDVYGVPIKFSKNCVDHVIAYNYEH